VEDLNLCEDFNSRLFRASSLFFSMTLCNDWLTLPTSFWTPLTLAKVSDFLTLSFILKLDDVGTFAFTLSELFPEHFFCLFAIAAFFFLSISSGLHLWGLDDVANEGPSTKPSLLGDEHTLCAGLLFPCELLVPFGWLLDSLFLARAASLLLLISSGVHLRVVSLCEDSSEPMFG
jgi:hypothetical protein